MRFFVEDEAAYVAAVEVEADNARAAARAYLSESDYPECLCTQFHHIIVCDAEAIEAAAAARAAADAAAALEAASLAALWEAAAAADAVIAELALAVDAAKEAAYDAEVASSAAARAAADERDVIRVRRDPEPLCGSEPHDSHEWRGGAVRSSGGGIAWDEDCVRCGLRRHFDTWGADGDTQGLRVLAYGPSAAVRGDGGYDGGAA